MIELLLMEIETDEDREKVLFIYNNYYSLMAYVIHSLTNNKDVTFDLTQDCLLRIIDNLELVDLSDLSRAKGLFITIAKNQAIDYLRKIQLNETVLIQDAVQNDLTVSVEEEVIGADSYNQIRDIIQNMNDTYRDVCLLKYVYGYREKEIALILNLSLKVVNQRIFRGKQELRKRIKEENLV